MKTFEKLLLVKEWLPNWLSTRLTLLFYDDLSKQQPRDTDPKAIQQINFTGNLEQAGNKTTFFILEKAKETICIFLKEPSECCKFHLLQYNIIVKMTQHHRINVTLSNSQLNKLSSTKKRDRSYSTVIIKNNWWF